MNRGDWTSPFPGVDLRVGAGIGPYTIRCTLGQGASALVLGVVDPSGRQLALKLLFNATSASMRRFEREGAVTAQLRHPGIVSVHAAGEVDGHPYLVYELVSGASLANALPDLDRSTRLKLLGEVALAVGYAHHMGVLHRDLKPDNVVVDESGHARVVDFGIAQSIGTERMTQTGAWVGSPAYMSPEQMGGKRDMFGPHSDVWALGVMLYESLTDRLPFDAQTVVGLIEQVARASPTPLRELDPTIPAALEAVCQRALLKDPSQRFADGNAFAAALTVALDPTTPEAPRRAHTRWALLAASALAGLATLTALGLWARQPTPAARPAEAPPAEQTPPPEQPPAPNPSTEVALILAEVRGVFEFQDPDQLIQRLNPLLLREGLSIELEVEAKELLASCYANKAERARMAGDNEAAHELIERAAEYAPALAYVLVERGWQLVAAADYEQARVTFAQALDKDPTHRSAHFGRGLCLTRLKRYREALPALEQAVAFKPKRRYVLLLTQVCQALGETKKLAEACSAGLEAEGPRDASYATLLDLRAHARRELQDLTGAVADCNALLEQQPESARLLRLRGEALSLLGQDPAQARADLERAAELDPADPKNVHELIHHLQRVQDGPGQLRLTLSATAAFPEDTHLLFDRARAHYLNGDFPASANDLDALLARDTDDELRGSLHLRRAEVRGYTGSAEVLEDLREAARLSASVDARQAVHLIAADVHCLLGYPTQGLFELDELPANGLSLARQQRVSTIRAHARLVQGAFETAGVELLALSKQRPPGEVRAYCLITLGAISSRVPWEDASEAFTANPWLGQLAACMRGELPESDLLAEARRGGKAAAGRLCEAHFYLALRHDAHGRTQAARLHYEACVGSGVWAFTEFQSALGRLRYLKR